MHDKEKYDRESKKHQIFLTVPVSSVFKFLNIV